MNIGISYRSHGTMDNGIVNLEKIYSYDFVGSPAFSEAILIDFDEQRKQEIIEKNNIRKKKLNSL
ncbi:hypothetical protein M0Q50_03830 [bacterium]|jgi:hypothetical protein|nr:hypothetical protein [bacterium]